MTSFAEQLDEVSTNLGIAGAVFNVPTSFGKTFKRMESAHDSMESAADSSGGGALRRRQSRLAMQVADAKATGTFRTRSSSFANVEMDEQRAMALRRQQEQQKFLTSSLDGSADVVRLHPSGGSVELGVKRLPSHDAKGSQGSATFERSGVLDLFGGASTGAMADIAKEERKRNRRRRRKSHYMKGEAMLRDDLKLFPPVHKLLPMRLLRKFDSEQPDLAQRRRARPKALIVDSNLIHLAACKIVYERYFEIVQCVPTADHAIDLLDHVVFDIALIAPDLPGELSGLDLVDAIRHVELKSRYSFRTLVVAMLTTAQAADTTLTDACFCSGMDRYLLKPAVLYVNLICDLMMSSSSSDAFRRLALETEWASNYEEMMKLFGDDSGARAAVEAVLSATGTEEADQRKATALIVNDSDRDRINGLHERQRREEVNRIINATAAMRKRISDLEYEIAMLEEEKARKTYMETRNLSTLLSMESRLKEAEQVVHDKSREAEQHRNKAEEYRIDLKNLLDSGSVNAAMVARAKQQVAHMQRRMEAVEREAMFRLDVAAQQQWNNYYGEAVHRSHDEVAQYIPAVATDASASWYRSMLESLRNGIGGSVDAIARTVDDVRAKVARSVDVEKPDLEAVVTNVKEQIGVLTKRLNRELQLLQLTADETAANVLVREMEFWKLLEDDEPRFIKELHRIHEHLDALHSRRVEDRGCQADAFSWELQTSWDLHRLLGDMMNTAEQNSGVAVSMNSSAPYLPDGSYRPDAHAQYEMFHLPEALQRCFAESRFVRALLPTLPLINGNAHLSDRVKRVVLTAVVERLHETETDVREEHRLVRNDVFKVAKSICGNLKLPCGDAAAADWSVLLQNLQNAAMELNTAVTKLQPKATESRSTNTATAGADDDSAPKGRGARPTRVAVAAGLETPSSRSASRDAPVSTTKQQSTSRKSVAGNAATPSLSSRTQGATSDSPRRTVGGSKGPSQSLASALASGSSRAYTPQPEVSSLHAGQQPSPMRPPTQPRSPSISSKQHSNLHSASPLPTESDSANLVPVENTFLVTADSPVTLREPDLTNVSAESPARPSDKDAGTPTYNSVSSVFAPVASQQRDFSSTTNNAKEDDMSTNSELAPVELVLSTDPTDLGATSGGGGLVMVRQASFPDSVVVPDPGPSDQLLSSVDDPNAFAALVADLRSFASDILREEIVDGSVRARRLSLVQCAYHMLGSCDALEELLARVAEAADRVDEAEEQTASLERRMGDERDWMESLHAAQLALAAEESVAWDAVAASATAELRRFIARLSVVERTAGDKLAAVTKQISELHVRDEWWARQVAQLTAQLGESQRSLQETAAMLQAARRLTVAEVAEVTSVSGRRSPLNSPRTVDRPSPKKGREGSLATTPRSSSLLPGAPPKSSPSSGILSLPPKLSLSNHEPLFDTTPPSLCVVLSPQPPLAPAALAGEVLPSTPTLSVAGTPPSVNEIAAIPGNVIPSGLILAAGVMLPPGTILPEGTCLPQGTVIDSETLLPAGTVVGEGTVLVPGTVISSGTHLPPGVVIPSGAVLPKGTRIASGTVVPLGTKIVIPFDAQPVGTGAKSPASTSPIRHEAAPIREDATLTFTTLPPQFGQGSGGGALPRGMAGHPTSFRRSRGGGGDGGAGTSSKPASVLQGQPRRPPPADGAPSVAPTDSTLMSAVETSMSDHFLPLLPGRNDLRQKPPTRMQLFPAATSASSRSEVNSVLITSAFQTGGGGGGPGQTHRARTRAEAIDEAFARYHEKNNAHLLALTQAQEDELLTFRIAAPTKSKVDGRPITYHRAKDGDGSAPLVPTGSPRTPQGEDAFRMGSRPGEGAKCGSESLSPAVGFGKDGHQYSSSFVPPQSAELRIGLPPSPGRSKIPLKPSNGSKHETLAQMMRAL